MSLMIEGGRRLSGDLTVQGAKNSVLPILAACILSGDVCILQRCPHLEDVDTSIDILRHLGCAVRWNGPDLEVDSSTLTRWDIPDRLMRRMRSSVVFLGAILARCGQAELSYPGGCAIGARPIDLHLSALRTLGACIREEGGSLDCTASGLAGAEIVLSIPSVGATENAMLAACGAEGTTVISNAAREPEIVDLQTFLQKMGAHVQGAGSSTVVVEDDGAAVSPSPKASPGTSDYNDTDYGPNNDGFTDYDSGSTNYGSTNYDDGGTTNYDDGSTNYDDGGSNYSDDDDD